MRKIILLLAAVLALESCKNGNTNANVASTSSTSPSSSNTVSQPAANNAAPAKVVKASRPVGEQNVLGKLVEVMDMDYPRAFLTVTDGKTKISANFSEEGDKPFKVAELSKLKKRQVNVFYLAQLSASVVDIQLNGASVLGVKPSDLLPTYKKVSGVLVAAEVTAGDLPSTLSVKSSDGTIYEFDYFITEVEVAQNGKTVEVFFAEVENNELISIESLD